MWGENCIVYAPDKTRIGRLESIEWPQKDTRHSARMTAEGHSSGPVGYGAFKLVRPRSDVSNDDVFGGSSCTPNQFNCKWLIENDWFQSDVDAILTFLELRIINTEPDGNCHVSNDFVVGNVSHKYVRKLFACTERTYVCVFINMLIKQSTCNCTHRVGRLMCCVSGWNACFDYFN